MCNNTANETTFQVAPITVSFTDFSVSNAIHLPVTIDPISARRESERAILQVLSDGTSFSASNTILCRSQMVDGGVLVGGSPPPMGARETDGFQRVPGEISVENSIKRRTKPPRPDLLAPVSNKWRRQNEADQTALRGVRRRRIGVVLI